MLFYLINWNPMDLEELPYLGFAIVLKIACSMSQHVMAHPAFVLLRMVILNWLSHFDALLFLLYINDLLLTSTASHFVLFADDTSVLISVSPYATDNSISHQVIS